jgi:hypothetical protein
MSETAVQLHTAKEPAVVLTKEDIRRYICPNADDKEVFMFLGVCKSFGLNPLKREVHLIKYGNAPASIVTGYEVYLKRAERTGKLNGWKVDIVQDGKAATVTIHRKDWTQPFEWTAYRQEFDKGQANWKTMPLFMLRKVAMAQAFRICFPDEMGGLPYLPEEVVGSTSEALPSGTVDTTVEPPPAPATPTPANSASQDAPGSTISPATTTIKEPEKDIQTLRSELAELGHIAVEAGIYRDHGDAIQDFASDEKFKSKCRDVAGMQKDWAIKKAIKKANAVLNSLPARVDIGDDQDINF